MKIEWTVLLITAFTDFMLTFLTGIATAMSISHETGLPGMPAIVLAACGGGVVAFRTIQQALRADPVTTAALKGQEPPVVVPAAVVAPLVVANQKEKS